MKSIIEKQSTKVMFSFLLLMSLCNLPLMAIKRYTTTNLNLRSKPNTHCQIITVIPKNTAVEIDEDCTCEWIPVQYGSSIGYVNTTYLTKSPTTQYPQIYHTAPVRYYINSFGEKVQSPTYYEYAPAGATALCRDGTYSYSNNRRGTCSHHGGVLKWLH